MVVDHAWMKSLNSKTWTDVALDVFISSSFWKISHLVEKNIYCVSWVDRDGSNPSEIFYLTAVDALGCGFPNQIKEIIAEHQKNKRAIN